MDWLYFSVQAAFLWSLVNTVDKVAVSRYIENSVVYLVFTGLASVLPVVVIGLFFPIESVGFGYVVLSVLTGVLYIGYTFFFFRALQVSDAPAVANMLLLVPVLSVGVGAIFFGEAYTLIVYLGIALVLFGVLGASTERSDLGSSGFFGRRITPALGLMAISAVITSADYALQKHILSVTDEVTLFFWSRVGTLSTVLLAMSAISALRVEFMATLRRMARIVVPISVCNESLDMVAAFSLLAAYARGPLSLVTTATAIQPLFVLFVVLALNKIRRGLVPSNGGRANFWLRLAAIAISVTGIYFISVADVN